MNSSYRRQEHPNSLALPRGLPQLELVLQTQREELHAENHSRRVPLQVLRPPDLMWMPTATGAEHRSSVLVTTGRPVVILDESLLTRVLGRGVENNPFGRTHRPASNLGLMSTILPYHQSLVSEQFFSEAVNGFQAVPDVETLPPPLSSDMPVVMYNSRKGSVKDWYQPAPKAVKQPLGVACDHPIITSLSEDEAVGDDASLPLAMSMQIKRGNAPTADHINTVPESPPSGSQCLSVTESTVYSNECPPPEEKPGDQSPLRSSQQERPFVSTEFPLRFQTQPETDIMQKGSAHDCEGVQVKESAYQEQEADSESSQNSFGKRILKAWTDSIVAMADGGTGPLLKMQNSSMPNQSKSTPYNKRCLPLRPSRAALVCAEREEQILQDSDSEIELEIPEMELEQQVEMVSNSLNTEEPPISSKEPCVAIPRPPPPPSCSQLGQPKASTLAHTSILRPKALAPESKVGELRLQSCFLNSESSNTPTGSLFSLGFTPLSPMKLTNSLRAGLPGGATATDTPQKESGNENTLKTMCPKEPPAKKPRLLDVLKMSENEEPLSQTAVNEDSSQEIRAAPQQSLPSSILISLNKEHLTDDAVTSDQKSGTNEIADLHPTVVQQHGAEVLDMVQPEVVQVNSPQHPHAFTSPELDYPHRPSEHADDGMDTVYQALPTESARQHALMPNLAPCRNEAGSQDDDDDDDDGRGNGFGAVVTAEVEKENILRHTAATSSKTVITISKDHELPHVETLEDDICNQESKSRFSQTVLTVPDAEPQGQSAKGDQQIVPESSLGSSFSVHSLYEGDSSEKWKVAPSHSLEEVDTDGLDGPSVLALALESMDARKRTLESPECQVPQMSPVRQRSCFSSSSTAWPHPQGLEIFPPSHVNLSKPRLRLGLSKKQRCKPLHH